MKYSVIGQSNTLVKGNFVDQLREKFPQHEPMTLGRVGASTSVIIPFFAADKLFLSGSKFCVIDVCVIDAGMVAGGQLDINVAKLILTWFGHFSRANGCEPIFLIIPTEHHLKSPHVRAAYFDMVKGVISEGKYLYIDASDLISHVVRKTGLSPSRACFDDPWHLNEETFADVAAMLSWFFDSAPAVSSRAAKVRVEVPHFRKVRPFAQRGEFAPRRHRSSAVSFDGVFVPLWGKLAIQLGAGTMFAAMINVSTSHCLARIRGEGEALIKFDIIPFSTRPFEARVVSVATPVMAQDGKTEIMPIPIVEAARISVPENPGLELGDIVVLDGEETLAYSHRRVVGDNNIFSRFLSAGGMLSPRESHIGRKIFADSILEFAARSGVDGAYLSDDQFAVCHVTLGTEQRLELPTPSGYFTGKITAGKPKDSKCAAIELRFQGGEPVLVRLSEELRTSLFEGKGDILSINSVPPGSPFLVDKVVMKPKQKRRIKVLASK